MGALIRYLFVVINTLHIAVALLLIGFSLWSKGASPIREVIINDPTSLGVVNFMLAIGCLLLIIGVGGALGNVFDNKVILGIYVLSSFVILVLEISVLAYGYAQRDQFKTQVQAVWTSSSNDVKFIIQDRFNCCGYISPVEWNGVYDVSCYQNQAANATWTEGCYTGIMTWIDQNVISLGVMVGGVLVVSLGQLILSVILLVKKIRKDKKKVDQLITDKGHVESPDFMKLKLNATSDGL